MFFERPEGTSFIVTGQALFYVIPIQANDRTEYRLLGIVDRTEGDLKSEDYSWSSVKVLYNFVPERSSRPSKRSPRNSRELRRR